PAFATLCACSAVTLFQAPPLLHLSFLFFSVLAQPPPPPLCPYTTLFRSRPKPRAAAWSYMPRPTPRTRCARSPPAPRSTPGCGRDRKSTRLNSSHVSTSYAVFCLKNTNETQCARAVCNDDKERTLADRDN